MFFSNDDLKLLERYPTRSQKAPSEPMPKERRRKPLKPGKLNPPKKSRKKYIHVRQQSILSDLAQSLLTLLVFVGFLLVALALNAVL